MLLRIARTFQEAYGGLPRSIWLFSFVLLVNRSGTMVLPFLALFLTDERGESPSAAGTVLGTYGVGAILGALLGGWLTVRLGAIRTQIASLAATGPLYLAVLYAPDFAAMLVAIFALSVCSEAIRPASSTATSEFCPERLHKKAFALNRLAVNLGMTVGPVVGGFLYMVNFDLLFYVDAASCLLAGVLIFVFFPAQRLVHDTKKASQSPLSVRRPWNDGPFLVFFGLMLIVAIVFFQLMSTYPLYLRDHYHFLPSTIGVLLAINTVVIVVFEMVLVHLVRRFNDLRIVAVGAVFVCVGFGLTPFGRGLGFAGFTVLIWTIGEMLTMPLSMAYTSRRATASTRGFYMGCYTLLYSLAAVFAPLLGTRLYEFSPDLPWHVSLAAGPIVFIGLILLSVVDQRPNSERILADDGNESPDSDHADERYSGPSEDRLHMPMGNEECASR